MTNTVVRNRIRLLVAGAVALWLSSMFFTVNEEEYAVVLFFGKPVRVEQDSGLKLKWPLPINSVARVDRRLLVYDSIATEFLTRDKQNLIAQTYTVWRVTDPERMLRVLGDRTEAEQRLDAHLVSAMGGAFGRYPFENLVNTDPEQVKIPKMMDEVREAVADTMAERGYGIEVEAVHLTRLSYPEVTLESVFKSMSTERKTFAERLRAEGESDADEIRSEAEKERETILAEARLKADTIRADAERQAADIFAGAYNASPEFYRFWRKLQALEKVVDDDTTLYLNEDHPLFSPLTTTPGQ